MPTFRQATITSLILSATSLVAGLGSLPAAAPIPGGIAVVPLGSAKPARPVRYHGEPVLVREDAKGWFAIVGLPLNAKPGSDTLDLGGRQVRFVIQPHRYPEQRLQVENQRHVTPNAEDEARIAREQALIAPNWKVWPEGRKASLQFTLPTTGKASSFGLKRFFNGEARAPHSGLDIAAPQGQAVKAPADGEVVLVGDFFFSGNSVFLAHGEGVVTLYCHLSRIDVQRGQKVLAGEALGLVGKTGRATGPHLHWALSLNNARVDPRLLLQAR